MLRPVAGFGRLARFAARLVSKTVRVAMGGKGAGPALLFRRLLSLQIWYGGVQALPIAIGAGVALGGVSLSVGYRTLADVGAASHFGQLMRLAIVGELVPLVTALVVIARSGTAIATELGRMKLGLEIDALEVHGVDAEAYLGAPRLVGVTVSTTVLTVLVSASTYVATIGLGPLFAATSRRGFARLLLDALTPLDVALCVAKATLFGLVLSVVCIYHGLSMARDPNAVPRAGSRAVVPAMVAVFAIDALLSLWLHG